jgi:hypothetical protein
VVPLFAKGMDDVRKLETKHVKRPDGAVEDAI